MSRPPSRRPSPRRPPHLAPGQPARALTVARSLAAPLAIPDATPLIDVDTWIAEHGLDSSTQYERHLANLLAEAQKLVATHDAADKRTHSKVQRRLKDIEYNSRPAAICSNSHLGSRADGSTRLSRSRSSTTAPYRRRYTSDAQVPNTRWARSAIEGLREAAEAFVIARFEDANLVAIHANRVTVMQKDLALVNVLRERVSGSGAQGPISYADRGRFDDAPEERRAAAAARAGAAAPQGQGGGDEEDEG
ncbi:centromeric DNA-binding histone H3-like protein cse4 [Geranomyces variabilis]|uniref:Centromeric DNA-binding histone H3-like protein cse4 n=1 Tax=Geranomyces variabilis TaxID=109894 RepID=A0AAD5XL52_9FUNG|nr:centromeric DNA-binding histone H3-like protein cse4 [Geranomyces variabilis]